MTEELPVELDYLAALRTGAWLDAQTFPPLEYVIPGMVPEGMTLTVGAPKIGKSWLKLGTALAVAAGGFALGHLKVDARPVLYLALEDGDRRMQDRCRKLLEGEPIPPAFEYMTTIEPGSVIATIGQWFSRHPGAKPYVILDTLGKVMPPARMGETTYQRDYRVGSALKRIVDEHPGSALDTNHHDRKAESDDFVDAVSGTHGLAGAADTIVVVTRSRLDTSGILKVTGRDVAEGEYALRVHNGAGWRLDGTTLAEAAARAAQLRATAGLGDRSAEIIAFIAAEGEVTASDVEAKFGKDTRRYLARLAEAGKLARPSRGHYSLPLSQPSQCPDDTLDLGQGDTWDRGTGDAA